MGIEGVRVAMIQDRYELNSSEVLKSVDGPREENLNICGEEIIFPRNRLAGKMGK